MNEHPTVEIDEAILARMRAICLTLPEAAESVAFGAPTFQVRAKNFAMLHEADAGRVSVWCKAPAGAQRAYVETEPERYFAPPYLGPKGWVAAWLSPEADPDWEEIEEIIVQSYRLIAPKRLVAAFDRERSASVGGKREM